MKGLAPEGFNSLALMASLLQGSNYDTHIPHDAYRVPPKQLHEKLAGKRFRMGWFYDHEIQDRVFTVGVLDDESFEAVQDMSKERRPVAFGF